METTRFQRTAQAVLGVGISFTAWPASKDSTLMWGIQITDSMNHKQVSAIVNLPDVVVDFNRVKGTIQILGREDE